MALSISIVKIDFCALVCRKQFVLRCASWVCFSSDFVGFVAHLIGRVDGKAIKCYSHELFRVWIVGVENANGQLVVMIQVMAVLCVPVAQVKWFSWYLEGQIQLLEKNSEWTYVCFFPRMTDFHTLSFKLEHQALHMQER